ncbi:MAG: T9SS type A sorting domain-containing protein, partial [Bacteroidia bacterium]|nr:T9SS type A sorting domain-containing protein [Bacteroidia bacterium]
YMKRKLLSAAILVLALTSSRAQYINTLHTPNSASFSVNNVANSSANGFYVQYFQSGGSVPTCIAKFDASGNLVWNNIYDIVGFNYDLRTICETQSGNVIGLGTTNQAIILSSYTGAGVPAWYDVRNISFGAGGSFTPPILAPDGTGAVFIAGISGRDSVIIGGISAAGALTMVKSFDLNTVTVGSVNTYTNAKAICKTAAGDFIAVLDVNNSTANSPLVIVKFNSAGTVSFIKHINTGGTLNYISGYDVQETSNGDIIVGVTMNLNSQDCAGLIRLDASGNLIWAKQIQNQPFGAYVTEHSNGEITLGIGVHTLVPDNIPKSSFIHLSSTGNFLWARNFGSSGSNNGIYKLGIGASGFVQALTYTNGYSALGSIGIINADNNGQMTGCHDILNSVPISSWVPTINTMPIVQTTLTPSLSSPSVPNSVAGMNFTQSNPGLSVSGIVSDPLCFGGFGNVNISASNGSLPYAYDWSNGTSNQNLLNVFDGTYTSRVSDVKGCVRIDTFTVTEPTQLAATSVVSHVTCFGAQNGVINVTTSGGTAGYTFQWATQDTTEDLSGLSGGFYQLIITDANNCTKTMGISVAEPQQLISGINASQNVSCSGLCDGTMNGIASGGTPPYSYLWNNSGSSTTQLVSGLCPGNYLFTVTDSKNCVTFSNGIITQPNPLNISTSSMGTSCGDTSGVAYAAATGGVAPYSYIWSNGTANDTTTNLNNGTYGVTVTDANGCIATSSTAVDISTASQQLCIVTVDSTNHNVLVWEKPVATNLAGFNIYRNIVGAYSLVDFVPYDSLSEYVDMTFGVDPAITSYRYEVSAVDTCGFESALSSYHQTIHLTTNLGVGGEINLVWDNYEGLAFSYNRILRDSTFSGNWQVLDSVAATNFTWTDLTPPDSARYLVEIIPGNSCTSTRAIVNTSRSNIKSQLAAPSAIGIAETTVLNAEVYPNPATDVLTILSPFAGSKTFIEVYDAQGKLLQTQNVNSNKFQFSVQELAHGIYFFRISESGLIKAKGKFQVN